MELSDLGIKSSLNGWQNFVRLAWMSAARLRKKRSKRLKDYLNTLPAGQVLELKNEDIFRIVNAEHKLAKVICEFDQDDDLAALL